MKTATRDAVFNYERRDDTLENLVEPLEKLCQRSDQLFAAHVGYADQGGHWRRLHRYLFVGPGTGSEYFRIGLFGGIHGDEAASILAIVEILRRLHANPQLARGYEIFAYPMCNPTGCLDGTRHARSGKDLNREFWCQSEEPEIRLLEQHLEHLRFHGIISLHTDDTSEGLYGFVKGHSLTRYVLEPALQKAEAILPRNYDKSIDNFEANQGVIFHGYPGVLSAPPTQQPKPFEIVFETPHLAPLEQQVEAHCVAVFEMLERFLMMISEAQNI